MQPGRKPSTCRCFLAILPRLRASINLSHPVPRTVRLQRLQLPPHQKQSETSILKAAGARTFSQEKVQKLEETCVLKSIWVQKLLPAPSLILAPGLQRDGASCRGQSPPEGTECFFFRRHSLLSRTLSF